MKSKYIVLDSIIFLFVVAVLFFVVDYNTPRRYMSTKYVPEDGVVVQPASPTMTSSGQTITPITVELQNQFFPLDSIATVYWRESSA